MVILKCKLCGGNVESAPGAAMGTCSSCGMTVTLPQTSDEKRMAFHNSGIHFRRQGDFDRAISIYERMLAEEPDDAEAHWGAALSRYGVVYSDDHIPEMKRPQITPFQEDADVIAALENAPEEAKAYYTEEAEKIAAVQPEKEDISALLKTAYMALDAQQWEAAEETLKQILIWEPNNGMARLGVLLAEQRCRKPVDLKDCEVPFEETEAYREALRCVDAATAQTLQRCAEHVSKHCKRQEARQIYKKAVTKMQRAKTEEEFRRVASAFHYISDYHDSAELETQCRQKADSLRRDGIYRAAVMAMNEGTYSEAADAFAMIPGWRDADELQAQCRERIVPPEIPKSPNVPKQRDGGKWVRIAVIVLVVILLLALGTWLLVTKYLIPQKQYDAANDLLQNNEREAAILAFQDLGDYRDAAQRAADIQFDWYSEAEKLLALGDVHRAAFAFGGLKDYADSKERSFGLWEEFAVRNYLSTGGQNTIALRADGMAFGAGRNEDGQSGAGTWLNISGVSAGWAHSVALRSDGTATGIGYNGDGRADVERWRNIVSVSAGEWHTLGLQTNGTVIATGYNEDGRCDVDTWREIIAVSAGRNHSVGLKTDGTVVAVGDNSAGQCNVSGWTKIVAVSAGGSHTVGLRSDGTVLVAGSNTEGQSEVGEWTYIAAVSAGYYHTVGLKKDGTVLAAGWNESGQCDVSKWKEIAAISAGGWHTAALTREGTVLTTGQNYYGQCDTEEWDNVQVPHWEESEE